ncbi:hypothetical protein NMG60_11001777 [Bertholletia excelsa]
MKKMKRASTSVRQSVQQEDAAKLKHQTLLQEYLQLQKEFVSRKRQLQTAKQKRDDLFAQVRFLRRRHRHLLKNQYLKLEHEKDPLVVQPQSSNVPREVLQKKRISSSRKPALGSSYSVSVSNLNGRDEEEGEGVEENRAKRLRVDDTRIWLVDKKRSGKKKILLRDQEPL